MAITFTEVSQAKYILLTTFTRDGRPKSTPIWVANDAGRLVVITQKNSWKVKRIRNTAHVTVAICDWRGNTKSEAVPALAAVLDESETENVYRAIGNRYGLIGQLFVMFSKLRGGAQHTIGLELRPA